MSNWSIDGSPAVVTGVEGTYIDQTDLEKYFGESNIAKWSNVENDDAGTDQTKITDALAFGESYVEDRMRDGPYAVPFVQTGGSFPATLKQVMIAWAGHYVYFARGTQDDNEEGNKMQKGADDADKLIDKFLSAQVRLALQKTSDTDVTGPMVAM